MQKLSVGLKSISKNKKRPIANIPSRELWIYQNPKALKSIQKGLQDAREGKIAEVKDVKEFLKKL